VVTASRPVTQSLTFVALGTTLMIRSGPAKIDWLGVQLEYARMSLMGGLRPILLSVVSIAAFAASVRTAHASCGDYVMIGGHHRLGSHHSEPAATEAAGESGLMPEHKQAPRPCSGLNCSRAPEPSPAPAPLRVVLVESDHLLADRDARHCRALGQSGWGCEPGSSRPRFSPADIFRPPRIAL
jgi:hypothetical protein